MDLLEINKPHFTYEGDQGPSHWASLTTDYSACGVGKNQSPIDISTNNSIAADFDDIEFNYTTSALNILNNGHTVQANYDAGSSISINGKTYNLAQFHFHTPSEHQFDGESSPIEMHLVHVSEEGDLAVVGVLFSEGEENSALLDIVEANPDSESEVETIAGVTVDANDLLPSETLEYRYSGSLTTPPCSEGVKWFVLQNSLELSSAQLSSFQEVLGTNNRPVQNLNAREVLLNSK
jgi:carbonic anhydrase